MKTEITTVKRLKKDGTIEISVSRKIAQMLGDGKMVLLPVDFIYGLVSIMDPFLMSTISKLTGGRDEDIVRMISSFKMLNEIADINKMEFDFLHRIWPGELIVYVRDIKNKNTAIPVRMPKSKYQQEIIDYIGRPLAYSTLYNANRGIMYRKKDIIGLLDGKVDLLLIIEEFCKEHTLPSIVDISNGDLVIVNEGRISAEEIKSLYFLGKDDSVL
jgi:tRNA A37 threonylcarbamoyladenosine synthetase subunit TsaC/SUA5/YrdC